MEKSVAILDADEKQCSELCVLLGERQFHAAPIHSLPDLKRYLQSSTCKAVIIDIDTVCIDNYAIKDLTIKNPGVYFFSMSKDRFHPDLKEVLGCHIYACIRKPVDPDELFYLLKSIYHNNVGPDYQPEG